MRAAIIMLVIGLAVPAAQAQFRINIGGTSISPQKANQTLRTLNARLQGAMKRVNRGYGKDPVREARDIKEAQAIAERVEADLTFDLRIAVQNYDIVKGNIAKLKADIQRGTLQYACSAARRAVSDENHQGRVASEALLTAFDQAVAALKGGVKDAKVLAFWAAEAQKARDGQQAVAARAQQQADKAAQRAHQKVVAGARKGLDALDRTLVDLVKANEGAIADDQLAAYEAAIEGVRKLDPEGPAFYESQRRRFRIYNAFQTRDPGRVATAVGGALVSGGLSQGKALKLSFAAEKGHCYSLWSRWKSASGGEKVNGFAWHAKKGAAVLQRYASWPGKWPWAAMRGVCVTQNTRVTATAALKFAGTTNGLEYAIVGFEKARFPVAEAVELSLHTGDRCDVESWKALWLDPVPGTVVWSGKEPFLLTSPSKAGSLWVTLTNVTGRSTVRARKTDLVDAAPKHRAFRTQLSVPKCLGLKGASSKLSIKLAKCSDRQRQKYDTLWDRAHRAKDNARTVGGWRAADRRLAKLGDKQRAEWDRTCGPTRRKIEKRFEAAYNAIVDHFVDSPPAPVVLRAARLRAEEASR